MTKNKQQAASKHDTSEKAEAKSTQTIENYTEGMVKMVSVTYTTYDGTCRRPLGECELGGACDICWYSPTHPRHKKDKNAKE